MVWFFAAVFLLLLVYNRDFRRVAFYLGGLGIVSCLVIAALAAPVGAERSLFAILAGGGLVGLLLKITAPPAVGSLAWARSRIRKL
jgi:hypothetical protein